MPPPTMATPPMAPPPMAAPADGAPVEGLKVQADDTVTLNFVGADIQAVIRAVAEITGMNILLDPRVTGTVNIVAPKPVPRNLVFPILESALRAQGFTAIAGDSGLIRVVPEAEAKFHAGTGESGSGLGDQMRTEVFRLDFEQAQQMVTALRPLVSPNNVINAFPATNTLVVTDYTENINRIRRLIASVDQPNPGELFTIKLRHASAIDVLQTIAHVMPEVRASGLPPAAPGTGATAGAGTPPNAPQAAQANGNERVLITVESRSNSLLVRSYNSALAGRIRQLVESLDTPTSSLGNLHVIYLRNAEATRIAETLRGILGAQSGNQQRGLTGSPFAQGQGGIGGQGGFGGSGNGAIGGVSSAGTSGQSTSGGFGGAASMSASSRSSTGVTGAAPTGFTAGGATVQAYPEMNSLVVVAPDYLYNQLRVAIDQLDARRTQIYIEALIVEVTSSKATEFGIQWQNLNGGATNGTAVIGSSNFSSSSFGGGGAANITAISQNPLSAGPGLNLGIMNGSVSIGGTQILNLGFLARALEQDSGANILSTPTLLTLDNEEAQIVVGQNIPIVTGSYTTASSGSSNPFTTVDRQDVGLMLRVRPQVTQGGGVKMQLYEENSTVVASSVNSTQGIITNKRSLSSTILIDDGQVIVIGGLIQDDVENTTQSVPILGSLPIIGNFFRYENRTRNKTNLMVFLRPVVLRDGQSAAGLTGDRYNYIRGVQQSVKWPERFALPEYPAPNLPEQFNRPPQNVTPPKTPIPEASGVVLDLRTAKPDKPAVAENGARSPAAVPSPAPEPGREPASEPAAGTASSPAPAAMAPISPMAPMAPMAPVAPVAPAAGAAPERTGYLMPAPSDAR